MKTVTAFVNHKEHGRIEFQIAEAFARDILKLQKIIREQRAKEAAKKHKA